MAEWFKAAARKRCYAGNRIGGSNPSPLRHYLLTSDVESLTLFPSHPCQELLE